MVLLEDVIKRLQFALPKYTNEFSQSIDIVSLSKSGSVVTAETSQQHGLQTNNRVLIKNAKTPYLIETLFRYKTTAIAITQNTNNSLANEVEISGADQVDYNGVKNVVAYPIYEIESIATTGGVATITTKEDHGIVFNSKIQINISGCFQSQYNRVVNITGIPSSNKITFNFNFEIQDATPTIGNVMKFKIEPNKYTISFKVDDNPTTPATGTIYNLVTFNNIYNGLKTITSIPTATSFTYNETTNIESPAQGDIKVKYNFRITSSASLTRAIQFFSNSKQEENWIIITLEDEITSRDPNVKNDADTLKEKTTTGFETTYTTLNLYIFVPSGSTNDEENINGRFARDFCASLKPAIHKVIAGYTFPNEFSSQDVYSPAVLLNNGTENYNVGFYVHRYSFQIIGRIFDSDYADETDMSRLETIKQDILNNEGKDVDTKIDIEY